MNSACVLYDVPIQGHDTALETVVQWLDDPYARVEDGLLKISGTDPQEPKHQQTLWVPLTALGSVHFFCDPEEPDDAQDD